MKDKNKYCPIRFNGAFNHPPDCNCKECDEAKHCIRSECALWISSIYSTENIDLGGMCSLVVMALKNQDGKIPV